MDQSYIRLPEEKYELMGDYIAGFVEGEGCFSLSMYKDKRYAKGVQPYPSFTLQVHIIDLPLIKKIKKTLNCGRIYYNEERKIVNYKVYKRSDIVNKVIPFFDRYQFHGNKKKSFEIFKEIMNLLLLKKKLSDEDIAHLFYLKESMNSREDFDGEQWT